MSSRHDMFALRGALEAERAAIESIVDDAKRARDRALDRDFAAQMICPHGLNLDEELCERCADDDAETDAL